MIRKLWSCLVLALVIGCAEDPGPSSGRLAIVCTTGMVGDLVTNIAGDTADITTLMGPGVDPHYYKASKGDVEKLARADVIFYNGLLLEGKMTDTLVRAATSVGTAAKTSVATNASTAAYSITDGADDSSVT